MTKQFYKINNSTQFLFRKKYLLFSSILLISVAILFGYFINKINFCGEITIQFDLKKKNANFQLFAYSPTGRIVDFYSVNSNTFYIKGYYNSLNIKTEREDVPVNFDSAYININGKVFCVDKNNFSAYWKHLSNEKNNSFYSLKTDIAPTTWLYKLYGLIFFTFPNFVLFFIFLVLLFLIYWSLGNYFKKLLYNLVPLVEKKILLFCFVLLLVYVAIFSSISRRNDKIKISGDYPVYQITAVNLIKGQGLDLQSFFDKYKFDNVIIDSVYYDDYYKENLSCENSRLSAWVPPAYPIFLSIVYKIFGVSPYIARYIQLLLLLIVAAFIPLWMFYYFRIQGFILGIVAGFIFIINFYPIANEIMTEPLTIFFCFLLLFSIKYFELKMSNFSSVFFGVSLTCALLVKGVVVFFVSFYIILMIYRYFKRKNPLYSRKILIVFVAFFVSLLPWIIYSNLNEGIIQKLSFSKEEISEDKVKLTTILLDVEKLKSFKQFDSTLLEANKNEFHIHQVTKFINRSCYLIDDEILSASQKRNFFIITLKQIITRIDNLLKVPYLKFNEGTYIYFNKPILISTNHTFEIYESNNKKCIDGDIHCDKTIKETYDGNPDAPSIIRVLNFYSQNPRYIFIIFPNKLFNAFHNLPFFLILMSLVLSNLILLMLFKKGFTTNKFKKVLLFMLVPFLMFLADYNVVWFTICFILSVGGICTAIIQKRSLFLFHLPLSSNLMILNFVIITLIFFGNKRITSIIDFVFITSSIIYFFHYYGILTGRNVFKKDQ